MPDPTSHIVPDTNQCLHWKRLDQIDWPSIAAASKCLLHITPILIRELEEQKVHNKSEKLRERASAMVRWLASLMDRPDPIVLRPGVELAFIEHEPSIDLAAHRLSERIADDLLIAAALELADRLGERVSIASGDTGLKVKLRSRPTLAFLSPPEVDRLPIEPDRDRKELRELRTELAQLKSRRPKLAVVLANDETHIPVRLTQAFAEIPSLAEIKSQHPLLEADITEASSVLRGLSSIRFDRNRAFNEQLTRYYREYSLYEAELRRFRHFLRRAFEVSFKVRNVGRAPANQIDVMITFPPHVRLLHRSDVPKAPSAPKVPTQRSTSFPDPLGALFDPSMMTGIDPYQDGKPYVNEARNRVEYSVAALKHEFDHELGFVAAVFDKGAAPSSFEATFLAACNETDSEEGSLRFVID